MTADRNDARIRVRHAGTKEEVDDFEDEGARRV
jgi:hypothetical protein